MNVQKVAAALKQTDQLVCGGLVREGGRCAVGQLFYAAGKTEEEINEEQDAGAPYENMFDGLLGREYHMDRQDSDAVWHANDIDQHEGNCQRRDRMVEWALNYRKDLTS